VRMFMNDKYISISQLTRYLKYKFDQDSNLQEVFLKGEISNFKAHTRGHFYFTLKDEGSRINAVMFSSAASKMKFTPVDGMKVLVTGKISVYEVTGGYQIYVSNMLEDGVGNLYIAYEQLKKKLELEGLFNPSIKQKIPRIPDTIGIITAPTGAAIRDILSTIKRRWPLASTILFPSLVQGVEAASDIVRNIKKASEYKLDVLIVGRGGGSIEDMWCFNEEMVARAIFHCPIPIISAVGHEIDFTIADFVADLRAPTPTGAAELAVPNKKDVENYLYQLKSRLTKAITHKIEVLTKELNQWKDRYCFKNPLSIYQEKEQSLDFFIDRMEQGIYQVLDKNRSGLQLLSRHYIFTHPETLYQKQIDHYHITMKSLVRTYQIFIKDKEQVLSRNLGKLEAVSPVATMKRGYSITKKKNKIIKSIKDVKPKDKLTIQLVDGTIESEVI